MKVVGVLTAGLVLALAPTGAAFAGDGPKGTAYGNCSLSSAGGHVDRTGLAGSGHGGMVDLAKSKDGCLAKRALDPGTGTITDPGSVVPATSEG